ncbi:Rieske (2Fe-2S) protein [Pseudobacteriovorax antillogorgiicola]|uniref:3-phenylpropionate/trans-cinnamate dioxygenase ferredoxin subunit n=1 Tax=Pseudobacteriovorax antillogorgiicola TaxID=1513793 RepID=A0A1Y6BJC0_9BACT|nr:Rieske 2Fe-2S domain-containing protein [Pseudobacteriovorax antillogorgiicola]TCS56350.1 3-phenylpropionate/trans-cinnamate dioxygenase ferredoxin subunit [Pseudobacteriovorax antillogorgiicola]SMF06757.1 3-phenylpropionate/trans-cinnamate dioxygenase ferredoxin subunit [Pseudobacteriovorax antillogorgiicola]
MTWYNICKFDELQSDVLQRFELPAQAIVVVKSDDKVSAFQDRCSHQDIPLSDFGQIQDGEIICFAHGAKFCAADGKVLCAPATAPLKAFPCKVESGVVMVEVGP